MTNYVSDSFSATGNGTEVVVRHKRGGLVRISGTFAGTIAIQVQTGNDLERTLTDSDFVTESEYTEPSAKWIETPATLRWRAKCTAYTSGTAVVEING